MYKKFSLLTGLAASMFFLAAHPAMAEDTSGVVPSGQDTPDFYKSRAADLGLTGTEADDFVAKGAALANGAARVIGDEASGEAEQVPGLKQE